MAKTRNEANEKRAKELATELASLMKGDTLITEIAREILTEGRCPECWDEINGRCWSCFESRPEYD